MQVVGASFITPKDGGSGENVGNYSHTQRVAPPLPPSLGVINDSAGEFRWFSIHSRETGRPQGSPLHIGPHEDVGETLAVSLHFYFDWGSGAVPQFPLPLAAEGGE